jgi:hypothetical protein
MKKVLIVLLVVTILAMAGIALAVGINNTPHNIPQFITAKSGTEPCAFCHTPHVAGSPLVYPLWNRTQVSQNYTMYTSATFNMWNADTKTSEQVDSSTRACMQCHNGVASELINYPGRGRNTANPDASDYNFSTGVLLNFANLGTDLRQEHPVAFTYNATADSEGNNFPSVGAGAAVVTGTLRLYDGTNQMGCGTCHEPHNRFSYLGAGSTQVYFLRNATASDNGNANSALCRACHVNKY